MTIQLLNLLFRDDLGAKSIPKDFPGILKIKILLFRFAFILAQNFPILEIRLTILHARQLN